MEVPVVLPAEQFEHHRRQPGEPVQISRRRGSDINPTDAAKPHHRGSNLSATTIEATRSTTETTEQLKPAHTDCGILITRSPLLTRVPSKSRARVNPNAGDIFPAERHPPTSSPSNGQRATNRFSWRTTNGGAAGHYHGNSIEPERAGTRCTGHNICALAPPPLPSNPPRHIHFIPIVNAYPLRLQVDTGSRKWAGNRCQTAPKWAKHGKGSHLLCAWNQNFTESLQQLLAVYDVHVQGLGREVAEQTEVHAPAAVGEVMQYETHDLVMG